MASKGVTDRQRVAKAIVAAARAHGQEVGERLQERLAPALEEGQSLPDLVGFQQVLANHLQPALDELSSAVRDVDLEARKLDTTLVAKDSALDAFDAAVAGIGRILTGFDQLAGLSRFAEKVRLTLPFRRRSNTGGEELPPGPDDPEGPPDTELPPTFAVPEPLAAEK